MYRTVGPYFTTSGRFMYRRGGPLFHNKWAIHVSPRSIPISQQVGDSCIAAVDPYFTTSGRFMYRHD